MGKRREARLETRVPVRISLIDSKQESFTQAIMLDLSEGGMAVRCADDLNPKEALSIRFALPDSTEQITVTGEVSWQDRNGRYGIRFLDTPQASRRALKEWILSNAHKKLEGTPYALGHAAMPED